MSMTFLQQVQRLSQECDVSGTGPTSVVGQSGVYKNLVNWIATADEDVQRLRNDWKFMRGSFTVNTVSGTGEYAYGSCTDVTTGLAISHFREWMKDSLKSYLLSSGVGAEAPLPYIDYDFWYRFYNTGTQNNGQPLGFTTLPNMSIMLAPKPDAVYVVSGEYRKSATTMTANSDVPLYPSDYHMLAVYRAMMSYGRMYGAPEVYQDGEKKYKSMLNEMILTQVDPMQMRSTLA